MTQDKTKYVLVMMTETEANALLTAVIPPGHFADGPTRKRAKAGMEKLAAAAGQPLTADVTTVKRALAKLHGA